MRLIRKYLRVWYLMTAYGMVQLFYTRLGATIFLLGKALRFTFFMVLLLRVVNHTTVLRGYTLPQVVIFFLTFNIIDTGSQMLFRGVYFFRRLVVSGDFDLILSKPISSLFRSMFSNTDLLDFVVFVPLVLSTSWYLSSNHLLFNLTNFVCYLLLILNGFFIAFSLHVLVVSLAIVTTEIDSTIMFYRDLTSMSRVPVDFYHQPVRGLITFAVPIGIMMTFPAKALFGLLSWQVVVYSFVFSSVLLLISLQLWQVALRNYSSASS
jgi:ABC-2 type transport system permease protein